MSELKEHRFIGTDELFHDANAGALYYEKSEADKVIAEKDEEIAGLKAAAKEPSVPNRECRKCGSVGTLMYMPIVKDGRTYWDLYNNKGIDYVVGIQCAHCGEVAFVTKQTHEYELNQQKRKRCLALAKIASDNLHIHNSFYAMGKMDFEQKKCERYERHRLKWLAIADKFKEA